ncbi:hypothetical protein [Algoriphagus pacificus]|uniref:Lipoprotein n=1 Tax=Algoriphagus pacificus TaxID=2811234 RepID=A0ABS3CHL1_9BACT|nr:hypothetical protein [Algoriphagus pacificus]MBN7816029.1 hypothetical protein [Algoriphagus pacificus]
MKTILFKASLLISLSILAGCADKSYPENMTAEERKAYYEEFNNSKTPEEWEEIRNNRKANTAETLQETDTLPSAESRNPGSIPFSIKNNSIFPKKLRIADNVLSFYPFEKRYVGFYPQTKVYLIKGENKEELLFEVKSEDKGKTFAIHASE